MGVIIVIMVILLLIAGLGLALNSAIEKPYQDKLRQRMGDEEYEKFQKESYKKGVEKEEAKKYNNYMIECPICHSKKVRSISNTERAVSVTALGLASSKIGKQYECTNCHHRF